jgi:hypothetical protein
VQQLYIVISEQSYWHASIESCRLSALGAVYVDTGLALMCVSTNTMVLVHKCKQKNAMR